MRANITLLSYLCASKMNRMKYVKDRKQKEMQEEKVQEKEMEQEPCVEE